MRIIDHAPLREICWFKTGGVAEYYCRCTSLVEVIEAAKYAVERNIPYRVIGEGSNLLVSDSGYPGMVIHNASRALSFSHDRSRVIADSGVLLRELITRSATEGYSGLEFLVNVPGTLGGAVATNAAAFFIQMSDYIRSATLFLPNAKGGGEIQPVDASWFDFSYRKSKLSHLGYEDVRHPPILLSVTLQLAKMNAAACMHRISHYQKLRHDTPEVGRPALQVFDALTYETAPKVSSHRRALNFPAPVCVDKVKLKSLKQPNVWVHPPNPNYVVGNGAGTSREAADLIEQIRSTMTEDVIPVIEPFGLWH